MKVVKTINGVQYAIGQWRNVNGIQQDLNAFPSELVWITSDLDNEILQNVTDIIKEKVRVIISLGKEKDHLLECFHNDVELIVEALSIEEAVNIASMVSIESEVVLFTEKEESYSENLFLDAISKIEE